MIRKNHYILNRIKKDGFIAIESYENKEDYNKRRDLQERKLLKSKENQTNEKKFSPLETENESNDVLKVIKLIEIISKGVSGYKHLIKNNNRIRMFEIVTSSLYKLIYKVFDLSNQEYEEFYNEFTNRIIEKDPNKTSVEIEKQITNLLYDLLSTFSLNIITGISNIFVTKNSIEIVNSIPDYNEKNELLFNNVLLKCICFERYGHEEKFINYVISVFDELKTFDQKNMIKRILFHFIISKSLNYQNLEKLCSKLNLNREKIFLLNPDINKLTNTLTKKIGVK